MPCGNTRLISTPTRVKVSCATCRTRMLCMQVLCCMYVPRTVGYMSRRIAHLCIFPTPQRVPDHCTVTCGEHRKVVTPMSTGDASCHDQSVPSAVGETQ